MRRLPIFIAVFLFSGIGPAWSEKPLLRDFIGVNGHYPFQPKLYRPVAGLVRNYHNMDWDVAKPGDPPTFPHCVNGVNWETVYGPWKAGGFEIDLCAQFVKFGTQHEDHRGLWKGREAWARLYGREMARFFGPTHGKNLISSIEIGNEPGFEFDEKLYQTIFREMATGIREGDPKIKISTCAVHAGPAGKYARSLDESFSDPALLSLVDVISVHTYAELPEGIRKHPWDRTYPEDPRSPFLTVVDQVVTWRDAKAPGREIWVTEFGWDACSPEAMERREGWFKKLGWEGVSELDQARFLVRGLLLLAARPVDRAYIFYYDDDDSPSVHGSSGLTRKFEPKPSYYALKQMQQVLGTFRFDRKVREEGGLHAYAFVSDRGEERWALWRSSGDEAEINLNTLDPSRQIQSLEEMAINEKPPQEHATPKSWRVNGNIVYLTVRKS
jgi:hypothetical protein